MATGPVSGQPTQTPASSGAPSAPSGGGADAGGQMAAIREASGADAMLEDAGEARQSSMEAAQAETATTREAGSAIAQSADGKEAPKAPSSAAQSTIDNSNDAAS